MEPLETFDVYLEIGKKKTFAGALDWPGWIVSGRDEASALQALLDHGPRYAGAISSSGVAFTPPVDVSQFMLVERLEGNATTDFGAPAVLPNGYLQPVDEAELLRLQNLIRACWTAFDQGAAAAVGKELRKGPRGGGRDLDSIVRHTMESEASYLSKAGGTRSKDRSASIEAQWAYNRQEVLDGLAGLARGSVPEHGPRGGARWPARYFACHIAWHILDHLWEIENRIL